MECWRGFWRRLRIGRLRRLLGGAERALVVGGGRRSIGSKKPDEWESEQVAWGLF